MSPRTPLLFSGVYRMPAFLLKARCSKYVLKSAAVLALVFCSCSSAPRRPPQINSARSAAAVQLELANKEAGAGNYALAEEYLKEVKRTAEACDDPELLVLTGLAEANVFFYTGRAAEARLRIENALSFSLEEENAQLAALCGVHLARFDMLLEPRNSEAAAHALAAAKKNAWVFEKDSLNAAFCWTSAALAEKNMGNYGSAQEFLKKALDIHLSRNYLAEAAWDWYISASVFSMAADYGGAKKALRNAVLLDRRAENSMGLGMDYMAVGDVCRKSGDEAGAVSAFSRAERIFAAARMENEAKEAVKRRLYNN